MEKKVFIILLSVVLLASSGVMAANDNVGTSCASFLKMGVGARAIAMGGAFVAQANDFTALYWNPAGIATLGHNEIGFAHTDWVLDMKHMFVGATYTPSATSGTFGVSINYLDMGEMERTTPAEPNGTGTFFSPSDFAIGLAYARNLTDRFTIGLKGKYIRETISFSSAGTFAVDVGTQFVTGFYGMRLGMAIVNFGGKMLMMGTDQMVLADADPGIGGTPEEDARLETEDWPLPMIFRFGVSFDVMKNDMMGLVVNADFNDPRDMNPYTSFGAEYSFKEMVFLRGGLNYRPDSYDQDKLADEGDLALIYEAHFTFGGGLLLQIPGTSMKMAVDYAYSDQYLLESTHRISVGLTF